MDIKTVLKDIGLSDGETKVYLALLKLGSVPVSDIKEETQIHRTTIYDFLENLLNKGLVSYVIKNNVKFYKAAEPDKLLEILKEKEENLKEILPTLTKLSEIQKEEIKVEIYKGLEGFKTVHNDIIKVGKDLIGFGVDEIRFKEMSSVFMEQYFKKKYEKGIKERLLTSEKAKFIFDKKGTYYRFIPDEFFNPTATFVYWNKVAIIVWEPLTIIMIENQGLAESYKKYFELLWSYAGKKHKFTNR